MEAETDDVAFAELQIDGSSLDERGLSRTTLSLWALELEPVQWTVHAQNSHG